MRRLLGLACLTALVAAMLLASNVSVALGNHVGCGDVITQDTKLDSDLIACPGDGVVIGADDITLDLNGHTIAGIASIYPAGVSNSGFDGVTIRGGEIRAFRAGAEFLEVSRSTIEDLSLINYAGVVIRGDINRVERNTISSGELDYGAGIVLLYGSGNRVVDNSVRSVGVGITLHSTERNRIARNSISENYSGLSLIAARQNLIQHNLIDVHGDYGVVMQEAVANLLAGNSIRGGRVGMIVGSDSNDNVIHTNSVSAGRDYGIHIYSTASSEVTRNQVFDTGGHGIYVTLANGQVRLERNTASHNLEDGIHIDGRFGGQGAAVARNSVSYNGDDGIEVGAADSLVRKNTADHNADLGIEAVAGVTDGGGNRAFSNGDPLQCLNVRCK
jgi:parallel beta-helix repeat protein